jgi:hypothetical protein
VSVSDDTPSFNTAFYVVKKELIKLFISYTGKKSTLIVQITYTYHGHKNVHQLCRTNTVMSQAIQRQPTKIFLHIITLRNPIKEKYPSSTCAVQYLHPACRYNFLSSKHVLLLKNTLAFLPVHSYIF